MLLSQRFECEKYISLTFQYCKHENGTVGKAFLHVGHRVLFPTWQPAPSSFEISLTIMAPESNLASIFIILWLSGYSV